MDVAQLEALADQHEPPQEEWEDHPSWLALHMALFNPEEYTAQQLQQLADNMLTEVDAGMPIMPPIWHFHIQDQLNEGDGEEELWNPEDDDDERTLTGDAEELTPYGSEEEDERRRGRTGRF